MNYFTSKIETIRDKIVTMQLSATVSHQIVHYRSPEEQFHSFSSIGNETKVLRTEISPVSQNLFDDVMHCR